MRKFIKKVSKIYYLFMATNFLYTNLLFMKKMRHLIQKKVKKITTYC